MFAGNINISVAGRASYAELGGSARGNMHCADSMTSLGRMEYYICIRFVLHLRSCDVDAIFWSHSSAIKEYLTNFKALEGTNYFQAR
jgi:hypothetical protein